MTRGCCEDEATSAVEQGSPCCSQTEDAAPEAGGCCGAPGPAVGRSSGGCCGGDAPGKSRANHRVPLTGHLSTLAGNVPRVATGWGLRDWLGRAFVRLGFRRMSYAVAPGLYAVGHPGPDSPVLVSANYKLSFDVLRRAVDGVDAWILVLDSRGVNVWCAAGKGTFGTAELVRRVQATRLARVVRHRRLVVPQLGAPAVAAHEVERRTDFGVVFGPVRAADIPAFLDAGYRATPAMRRVTFGLWDRLEVSGLELATAGRATLALSLLVLAVTAWDGSGLSWSSAWNTSASVLVALWSGAIAGTVLFAALLPWLPGRMFSVKGAVLGALVAAGVWMGDVAPFPADGSGALRLALALVTVAVTSYLGANFTGSTTFTSLSGVKRELHLAIPAMALALIVATLLPAAALLLQGISR
jgi:hypothetical protein